MYPNFDCTLSLWQNPEKDYKDYVIEENDTHVTIKYDLPKKQRKFDDIIEEEPSFFMRKEGPNNWRIMGQVVEAHTYKSFHSFVIVNIEKHEEDYKIPFRAKTNAVEYLGYCPLGRWERTSGIINLKINPSYWLD